MSILQPPILSTSVVKTEPPTVIKNEPPEPEIMNIDFDEDIKNIDIVLHPLSEDMIKSETVPENIFESKHSGYVEAQACVKAENVSLVQIENVIECEKPKDTDDGNGTRDTEQEAVEVQGIRTKHPKKTDYARCHKTLESNLWKKQKEKIKVIKAPVIQCSFKTKHKCSLSSHQASRNCKNVEMEQKRFRCDHCDYKTDLRTNLKKHNLIHLKPEESQYFYCDHCSFKSRHKCWIKQHIFTIHNKNVERYSCDRCDFKTCYRRCLKAHNIIHLKPEDIQYFYCSNCSFKTKYKSSLSNHQLHCKNVEIEQKRFSCDRCDFKTRYSRSLKRHNIIHLKPEESQYFYCDHCSFKARHKSGLKKHIFGLHNKNVERFRCDHCDYKTHYYESFKMHNLIHLNPEEVQYFYCSHCSFKSKYKNNLRAHILRHFQNEEVKFCCYICDFMTLERELIIFHIKTHSKVRNKSKIDEGN